MNFSLPIQLSIADIYY